jgi:hypothetical protein
MSQNKSVTENPEGFLETHWESFGLRGGSNMSTALRLVIRAVISLIVILLASEALVVGVELRNRARAKKLLEDVSTLRVGTSTIQDVQTFIGGYDQTGTVGPSSSCQTADSTSSVRVSNDTLNEILRRPILRTIFPSRPWGASAVFEFSNGKVCDVSYNLDVLGDKDQDLRASIEIRGVRSPDAVSDNGPYIVQYETSRGYLHILQVWITEQASEAQHSRAFDLNFDPIVNFADCRTAGDLNPSAWNDYEHSSGAAS